MDRHRRQLIRALEARDPDRAELQMRQYILEAREMLIPPGDERAEPGAVDTVEG